MTETELLNLKQGMFECATSDLPRNDTLVMAAAQPKNPGAARAGNAEQI